MSRFGYLLVGAVFVFSLMATGVNLSEYDFRVALAAEKATESKPNYFTKKKKSSKKSSRRHLQI